MYEFSEYMEKPVVCDMMIEELLSLKNDCDKLTFLVDLLKSRKNGEDDVIAKEIKRIENDVEILTCRFENVLEGLYHVKTEEEDS